MRTISEGLRQEAGDSLRVTVVSPGAVRTDFAERMDPAVKDQIDKMMEIALSPDAVARAIAFAIEQPDGVDVGDIVVRPTAQGIGLRNQAAHPHVPTEPTGLFLGRRGEPERAVARRGTGRPRR